MKHKEGLQFLYTRLSSKMHAIGEFTALYETQSKKGRPLADWPKRKKI
jgi:hypothetical protein